jgi:hypothetical protein
VASADKAGKRGATRGAARGAAFDPYAILAALDAHRVSYVVVGAFARVIHGTAELTDGLDVTPSLRPENLTRLERALDELQARRADGARIDLHAQREPVLELQTDAGELKLVPQPAGSRGYDDLRRHASREPLGHGLRPRVASPGDLARMLGALDREHDRAALLRLRRAIELDRSRGRTLSRER